MALGAAQQDDLSGSTLPQPPELLGTAVEEPRAAEAPLRETQQGSGEYAPDPSADSDRIALDNVKLRRTQKRAQRGQRDKPLGRRHRQQAAASYLSTLAGDGITTFNFAGYCAAACFGQTPPIEALIAAPVPARDTSRLSRYQPRPWNKYLSPNRLL